MNFQVGSHWVLVEEVLPHVQLLVREGWDGDFEFDDQVARVPLLV